MVNTLDTPCGNTRLVQLLIEQLKFKIVLKRSETGRVLVLLDAVVLHPVLRVLKLFWISTVL
jgi:hypothetical protein